MSHHQTLRVVDLQCSWTSIICQQKRWFYYQYTGCISYSNTVLHLSWYSYISGLIKDHWMMQYRDGWSGILNYHSNFLIGSTFWIGSPISQISITRPSYQQIYGNSPAKLKYDVYHLWISNGRNISILNGHCLSAGNLICSCQPNLYSLMLQWFIVDETMCHQYQTTMASRDMQSHIRDTLVTNDQHIGASATNLVSVWNTRVFWMARTALTEPRTLWRRITWFPSPRRRVALHSRAPGSAGNKPVSVWEHLESQ